METSALSFHPDARARMQMLIKMHDDASRRSLSSTSDSEGAARKLARLQSLAGGRMDSYRRFERD